MHPCTENLNKQIKKKIEIIIEFNFHFIFTTSIIYFTSNKLKANFKRLAIEKQTRNLVENVV